MSKLQLLLIACSFALGACGGGSDSNPPPNDDSTSMMPPGDMGNDSGAGNQSQFVHAGATVTSTCPTCTSNTGLPNANDGDDATFAEATFPMGGQAGVVTTRVDAADGVSFPAGPTVGARIFLAGGISVVWTVTINTYLGDVQQESFGPEDTADSVAIDVTEEFTFTSTQPYDAVEAVVQYTAGSPIIGPINTRLFEFRG